VRFFEKNQVFEIIESLLDPSLGEGILAKNASTSQTSNYFPLEPIS